MQEALVSNLLTVARTYAHAKGLALTSIGQRAAGDWRFFSTISNPSKTFTVKKYDEVVSWFEDNWPEDLEWPTLVYENRLNKSASEMSDVG